MLSQRTEELIKRIKKNENLNDIRFIRAYSGRAGDYPVKSGLVTVAEGKEDETFFAGGYSGNGERGERLYTSLILNIYCPCQSGGDGITTIVNHIRDSLSTADIRRIVDRVKVSEIKFSKNYEALYRTMEINLDFVRKECMV